MINGFARLELAGAVNEVYAVLLGDGLSASGVTVTGADTTRVVLGTDDPSKTLERLGRRGLPSEGADVLVNGLAFGIEQADAPGEGSIALDHVVVHTADAEGAVANYAGRLGLDLRLERHAPQWGSHMLFLRCGRSVLELSLIHI